MGYTVVENLLLSLLSLLLHQLLAHLIFGTFRQLASVVTHDEFGGGEAVGSTVLPSAICNRGSHHGEIAGMPVALSLGSCPGDVHVLCGSSEWDRVCSSVYTSLIVSSTAPAGGSVC